MHILPNSVDYCWYQHENWSNVAQKGYIMGFPLGWQTFLERNTDPKEVEERAKPLQMVCNNNYYYTMLHMNKT